jgi:hypothetical protein
MRNAKENGEISAQNFTKRELATLMIAQGKSAAGRFHAADVARESVEMADAILAELERTA